MRNKLTGAADFKNYLQKILKHEIASLNFIDELSGELTIKSLKVLAERAQEFAAALVREVVAFPIEPYRKFVRTAIHEMSELSAHDDILAEGVAENRLPETLFRAFELMDEVFQLKSGDESEMILDPHSSERIYKGGAAGVQTSYATILTVLRDLNLPSGAHLIDLGSGYGRVGLVAGLWRDDLHFTGYEFAGSRVERAKLSAERAGVVDHVQFFEQDLGALEFAIPEADVYYLYDPFSAETYLRVVTQLLAIGRQRAITIVAKGNARDWFTGDVWEAPEFHDHGSASFFRSKPQRS